MGERDAEPRGAWAIDKSRGHASSRTPRNVRLLPAGGSNGCGKAELLLGRERRLTAYPYRSLLDAGVNLSFGSDFPGERTYDPLIGIYWAVTREGPEAISIEVALRCYTIESARAEGTENIKGSIEPGKLADFVVLSRNPLVSGAESLRKIQVKQTIVGGKTVFRAAPSAT